jgi:preprotein translocase subunit SecA
MKSGGRLSRLKTGGRLSRPKTGGRLSRPFPGVVWGEYPQHEPASSASRMAAGWRGALAMAVRPRLGPYRRFAQRVEALLHEQGHLDEQALAQQLGQLRRQLASHSQWDEPGLVAACALACAALESTLAIQPYTTQVMAARVMLDNRLAEMATGEGKTVAIALAAAIAALGQTPVHIVTANDYLAARDAQAMAPFFSALGLSVGAVTRPLDQAARRKAWACDVTYCTAKELVFDYLRDGMSRPRGMAELERRALRLASGPAALAAGQGNLLRGLCMAIVDEADTVLIDEASAQAATRPGSSHWLWLAS